MTQTGQENGGNFFSVKRNPAYYPDWMVRAQSCGLHR
jgi:hypothetical protein